MTGQPVITCHAIMGEVARFEGLIFGIRGLRAGCLGVARAKGLRLKRLPAAHSRNLARPYRCFFLSRAGGVLVNGIARSGESRYFE
jgi:hypothetical protein